jgi:hypothetical protein
VEFKSSVDSIVGFVDSLQNIPQETRESLKQGIKCLPRSILINLHTCIKSDIEMAINLAWETKLKEYIEGFPPPQKYETDRGARNPIEFLEDVWGEYMNRGVLYQDMLTSYDDKLIPAIYRYWTRIRRMTQ